MGVTGLWQVLESHPVSLESLQGSRLAVDASIWMHQFSAAMRDKKGDLIQGAHLIGFYNRILKLLFYRLKPVFVFDGAVPDLKKSTIQARLQRKQSNSTNVERTAKLILDAQLKLAAINSSSKGKRSLESEDNPQIFSKRQKNSVDLFELPKDSSNTSSSSSSASFQDPRLATERELAFIDQQLSHGQLIKDIMIDTSKINIDSDAFKALPQETQYQIILELKLKSRAPNAQRVVEMLNNGSADDGNLGESSTDSRMMQDFSKKQIQNLVHRATLTQRAYSVAKQQQNQSLATTHFQKKSNVSITHSRIASQRNKSMILVKSNDNESSGSIGVKLSVKESNVVPLTSVEGMAGFAKSRNHPKSNHPAFENDGETSSSKPASQSIDDSMKKNSSFNELSQIEENQKRDFGIDGSESLDFILAKIAESERESAQKNFYFSSSNCSSISSMENQAVNSDPNSAQDDGAPLKKKGLNYYLASKFIGNWVRRKPEGFDDDFALPSSSSTRSIISIETLSKSIDELDRLKRTAMKQKHTLVSNSFRYQANFSFYMDFLDACVLFHQYSNECVDNDGNGLLIENEDEEKDSASGLESLMTIKTAKNTDKTVKVGKFLLNEYAEGFGDDDDLDLAAAEAIMMASSPTKPSSPDSRYNASPSSPLKEATKLDYFGGKMENKIEIVQSSEKPDFFEGSDVQMQNIVGPTSSFATSKNINDFILYSDEDDNEKGPKEQTNETSQKTDWETIRFVEKIVQSSPDAKAQPNNQYNQDNFTILDENVVIIDSSSDDDFAFPVESSTNSSKETSNYKDEESIESIILLSEEKETLFPITKEINEAPMAPSQKVTIADISGFLKLASDKSSSAKLKQTLQNQIANLEVEYRRLQRNSSEPTLEMVTEIQQLLKYFGLPFITSPMEAESQCAALERMKLVDGIITEDSDVFLFGGKTVYKNFFHQKEYVQCYDSVGMSRDELISFALLTGSDYTPGVKGVGPVLAKEIIEIWNGIEGLKKFRSFCKSSKEKKEVNLPEGIHPSKKIRKLAERIELDQKFPDERVISCYMNPIIDDNPSSFVWGSPQIEMIRNYMERKAGWSSSKTDQTLLPVLREIEKPISKRHQPTIDSFFGKKNKETTRKAAK